MTVYLLICLLSSAEPRCAVLSEVDSLPECFGAVRALAGRVSARNGMWDKTGTSTTLDWKPATLRCMEVNLSALQNQSAARQAEKDVRP